MAPAEHPHMSFFREKFVNFQDYMLGLIRSMPGELRIMRKKLKDLHQTNLDLALFHLESGNYYDASLRFKIALYFKPDDILSLYNLGRCLYKRKHYTKAEAALNKLQKLQAGYEEVDFFLKKLKSPHVKTGNPLSLLSEYNDNIAERYNMLYGRELDYQAPNLIYERIKQHIVNNKKNAESKTAKTKKAKESDIDIVENKQGGEKGDYTILDLGCGTGIGGILLKEKAIAKSLRGVDISPNMIVQARKLRTQDNEVVYDSFATSDVSHFLEQSKDAYDIILASSLIQFVKLLPPFFTACANALNKNGAFIVIIPTISDIKKEYDEPFPTMPGITCFLHNKEAITNAAKKAKLSVVSIEEETIYKKQQGLVCVFTKS